MLNCMSLAEVAPIRYMICNLLFKCYVKLENTGLDLVHSRVDTVQKLGLNYLVIFTLMPVLHK